MTQIHPDTRPDTRPRNRPRCDVRRTDAAPQARGRAAHPICRTCVSRHEISICGHGVHGMRLAPMISAATHAHLVVRRHVDLGRTRSMICWPR